MPSRFGRRPAAIRSRVPACEVPSARLTRMPPASRWTPWIVTPVWTLMPSLVRRADRKAPASGSSACMIREAISRMVTLLPSRAKACPSSTPTAPLPMITSVSGSSVACTASRFVQKDTVSRPGMGGADGAVPVAMTTLRLAVSRCSPTITVRGPRSRPSPRNTFAPSSSRARADRVSSRSRVIQATRACTLWKSTAHSTREAASSRARPASAITSADRRSVLLGMQP